MSLDREEREAAAEIVGFPELSARDASCRLCRLATEDGGDFLRRIHKLWREGGGPDVLEAELKQAWSLRHEPVVRARLYERHFTKHVQFAAMALATVAPARVSAAPPALALAQAFVAPVAPLAPVVSLPKLRGFEVEVSSTEAETQSYRTLERLTRRLETTLTDLEDGFEVRDDEGKIQGAELMALLKVVDALRATSVDLHKLRKDDVLMQAVLQRHTRRMVARLSEPLVVALEETIAHLDKLGTGRSDPVRALSQKLRAIVKSVADDSMRETTELLHLRA